MNVSLNAHLLSLGPSYRGAGISRYIRRLLAGLRALDDGDHFTVYLGDRRLPPELSLTAAFRPIVSRLPTVKPVVRLLWEQFLQPLRLQRDRADILHSLGYVQPVLCACRSIVTVHDLSFLRFPEAFNRSNRLYLSLFTALSVRRADRVIAVSRSTKEDLEQLLRVPADRVAVIYHGVEEEFRPLPSDRVAEFRLRESLPEHFIFYCGTLEPRKNVDLLIAAYAKLRRDSRLPHKLVLAGGKGWLSDRVFRAIEQSGLKDDIVLPGYLPSAVQPLWYNAADIFVYPSRYEGFGFPALEAMACGTPVIVSARSSLPEVVGGAGVLVDPDDSDAIAEAMRRVLADASLREDMAARGLERARDFSWTKAVRDTVALYHRTAD